MSHYVQPFETIIHEYGPYKQIWLTDLHPHGLDPGGGGIPVLHCAAPPLNPDDIT